MGAPKGSKNALGNKGGGRKTLSEEIIAKVQAKTFKEMMAKMIPDKLLAEKHLELLNKREKVVIEKGKDGESPVYEILDQPDTNAVSKGLDMAYKLKGEYAAEKKLIGVLKIEDLLDD